MVSLFSIGGMKWMFSIVENVHYRAYRGLFKKYVTFLYSWNKLEKLKPWKPSYSAQNEVCQNECQKDGVLTKENLTKLRIMRTVSKTHIVWKESQKVMWKTKSSNASHQFEIHQWIVKCHRSKATLTISKQTAHLPHSRHFSGHNPDWFSMFRLD